jgi:hypothetical protein
MRHQWPHPKEECCPWCCDPSRPHRPHPKRPHPHPHPRHDGCGCECHRVVVDVHVRQEPCDACRPGHLPPGPPSGGGGRLPPPPGTPADPWDILEIFREFCGGERGPGGSQQPPRKDLYLPYLLLRANPGDRGDRPLPSNTPFWESPDIFVVPAVRAQDAPDLPPTLGGVAQAGVPNAVYAHVWNLGKAPAFDVRVEFYWFNPSLGIEAADANLIGFTYVTLANRRSSRSHVVVKCPVDWVPVFENNGHECLVVRAYSIMTDRLGPNEWNASLNRHVAQRNIAVLHGAAQGQALTVNVAPGHSTHDATIITEQVPPRQMPWLQLLTMRRDPGLTRPAVAPVAGITIPTVQAQAPDLAQLPAEALATLLQQRQRFPRGDDPLQVTFFGKAPDLQPDEVHVVRVRQLHDGNLLGGYSIVMLP